jgi:LPXTG-motif cell wall-anchored protein
VTISKLIAAAGIAAVSLIGFAGAAHAAPTAGAETESTVCAEGGVLSVVVDDAGVQHEACVASAADAPVVPASAPLRTSLAPETTPTTPTTGADTLPKTGAGMGIAVIAAILVGTGSLASLLARRRS